MRILILALIATVCFAQQAAAPDPPKPAKFEPLPPRADGKARVFVGESDMFYSSGFGSSTLSASGGRAFGNAFGASMAGVAKFTITVMKSVNDTCPDKAVIVDSPDLADYFLRMDIEGVLLTRPKMVAFNRSGEMSYIASERKIDKDVKGFCATLPTTASTPTQPKKAKK